MYSNFFDSENFVRQIQSAFAEREVARIDEERKLRWAYDFGRRKIKDSSTDED